MGCIMFQEPLHQKNSMSCKVGKHIAVLCAMILIGTLIVAGIYANRPIRFYSNFAWWRSEWEVSPEVRALTKEIYDTHQQTLEIIKVAEDGRSYDCIRFVFVSNDPLPETDMQDILQSIYVYMLHREMVSRITVHRSWEVFFCTQTDITCAFVARYGTKMDSLVQQKDAEFTDWELVPEASTRISTEMLEKMLNDITFPMYYPSDQPIGDRIPMLPPYR